jgi:PAS domain S-box-containing protein
VSIEERIIQNAADAIIMADASGKITLWNAGAERLFGFSAAEALTRTLDIIIPEGQQKRHWEGFNHVMRTGVTKYGAQLLRVPGVRKDRSRVSITFTVSLLKDAAGSVEGIFAIVRDDSERWETERMLRRRIAQIENPGNHEELTR